VLAGNLVEIFEAFLVFFILAGR